MSSINSGDDCEIGRFGLLVFLDCSSAAARPQRPAACAMAAGLPPGFSRLSPIGNVLVDALRNPAVAVHSATVRYSVPQQYILGLPRGFSTWREGASGPKGAKVTLSARNTQQTTQKMGLFSKGATGNSRQIAPTPAPLRRGDLLSSVNKTLKRDPLLSFFRR